jgi:hypothetical protein
MATTRGDLSMDEFQHLFTENRLDTLRVSELKTILRYVQEKKGLSQIKLSGLKPVLLERINQIIYLDQEPVPNNYTENTEKQETEVHEIIEVHDEEEKPVATKKSTKLPPHRPPPVLQHLDMQSLLMYSSYGSSLAAQGSMNPHQYNQMLQQFYQQQDPVMMQQIMQQQQQQMIQQMQYMQQHGLQQQHMQYAQIEQTDPLHDFVLPHDEHTDDEKVVTATINGE